MSAVALHAPYRDTRPRDLSFALGLPALDALATAEVARPGLPRVELRLLGASHQVLAGPVRETVACLPDGAGALPARFDQHVDGWAYRFRARVRRHGPTEFAARVRRLRAELDGRADALFGAFPGAADAVTALAVRHPVGPRRRSPAAPDAASRAAFGAVPATASAAAPAAAVPATAPATAPGLGWRTWHSYPQSREIVETASWLGGWPRDPDGWPEDWPEGRPEAER